MSGIDFYFSYIKDTSGTFYGTTHEGGANGEGTVFSLTTGLNPSVALVRNPG